MTVQHVSITDPNIHEPKGASTAPNNSVYVANGAGSGSWTRTVYTISARIPNISNPTTVYLPIVYSGRVVRYTLTLQGAISGADDTVTLQNSAGSPMESMTVVQAGSGAGVTFTTNTTVNNTVVAGEHIRLVCDGASNTNVEALVEIVVERT